MIHIQRPGEETLEIDLIFIEFEGTLASDDRVPPKAKDKLNLLAKRARITILTKEQKERVEKVLRKVKAEIVYLTEGESSKTKLDLLRQSGAARAIAIGSGADDGPMMEEAAFSFCVIGKSGASSKAIENADVVFTDILDALDFLLKPLRQRAILSK